MVKLTEYEQKMLYGAEGPLRMWICFLSSGRAISWNWMAVKRLMQPPVAELTSAVGGSLPGKTVRWTRKQEAAGPFKIREETK